MKRCRLLLLALALSGCGPSARLDGPIEFWNGFSGPDGVEMTRIVGGYRDASGQPGAKMQIIPWSSYYDKITLSLQFGGAPDVFVLHANHLPFYADGGALQELSGLMKADQWGAEDFLALPLKQGAWKGKQYAIPLDCHITVLYYNKKIFREAGIASPPTNLPELQQAKKKIQARFGQGRNAPWTYMFANLATQSITFMGQEGGGVIDQNTGKASLSSPRSLSGLALMKSLVEDGTAPNPEGQNAWDAFKMGRAAMVSEGTYMIPDLLAQKDLDFGVAPFPQLGSRKAAWANSHLLVIKSGLSGSRQLRALSFIRHLSDQSFLWSLAGQYPVRKSILTGPSFRTKSLLAASAQQLDQALYEPAVVSSREIQNFAGPAFEQIILQGVRPEDAAAQADRRIQEVLSRP